ncbi:MAG: helicase, partial [Gammaproteobacteria bacterium]|nr:helicase [Gammaproteobacteria bacterium]
KRISYESYTQGKNIKEIAAERGLATNTIEGHLARYVKLGKLDVSDLVTERKINVIKEAFADKGKESLKVVKDHLGDDYSYGEIRLVRESLG